MWIGALTGKMASTGTPSTPSHLTRRELWNKHPNITIDQTQPEVRWQEKHFEKEHKGHSIRGME